MSLWRQLKHGMIALVRGRAAERELSEEVRQYVDEAIAELVARGMPVAEARRSVRLELGTASMAEEQVRRSAWENIVRTTLSDLRYGWRQLRMRPGFALVAILTLALGIGATTAIFSVVNPVLFENLPYRRAKQIVNLSEQHGDANLAVSFATFRGMKERTRSFQSLAVVRPWQPTLVGSAEPERFEGQRVSADYFRVLGVEPWVGRNFAASDDTFRGPHVVILSDTLWCRRFGADRTLIGRQITLNGDSYTVIGVMPRSFENVIAPDAELWAPLQYDPALPLDGREWGHHLRLIGRLRDHVSATDAANEARIAMREWSRANAHGYENSGGALTAMTVTSLQADLTANVRPALLAVIGAVVLVLVIACVNVTNLLLFRGVMRRSEFAVRAALGAGRARLVRQLLTECVLLASIGGMAGLLIAHAGVRTLVALSPAELPRVNAIRVDTSVFLFVFGMSLLVGLAVGLVPALRATRDDPHSALQQATRLSTTQNRKLRHSLVISEVALALMLSISAGLLLRSMRHVFSVDPGFDASHLLTMQVQESGSRFIDDKAAAQFFEQALEAVRHVPGVVDAALTSQLPLSGDYDAYGTEFEGDAHGKFTPAFRYSVTPAYFATMRIPLRRGRLLNDQDRRGAPVAVLISESLAERKFRGRDAVGQRLRVGPHAGRADAPWATIVGVVGNVRHVSLATADSDAVYTTIQQWQWVDAAQSLVVRCSGDAAALAPAIRAAIWSVDKDQPIVRVATMNKLVATSESERRFALFVFGDFACAGLGLALVGIYGVLAGAVTERTREIGVRLALGASRADIVGMVIRDGVLLAGIGTVIGIVASAFATRGLQSMLFEISHVDAPTYAALVVVLLTVSALACAIPAIRASRVDPAITLRAE